MLWQLHFKFKDGHIDMIAQKDLNSLDEARDFISETKLRHNLPVGAIWMICNEESSDFVKMGGGRWLTKI